MAKKKRKKPGLKADPKRQAHDQLRGYRYQILHSVDAWLDLEGTEILYLECAEDFEKNSGDTATAVQVKDTRHRITLRSQDVNDAINHYWELRTSNPDRSVRFRFLTRSEIGVEQGAPFGKNRPGLQSWSRCSGDEENIKRISGFLQNEGKISEGVKDFLNQAEPQEIYEQLIKPISWETGSKPASFVEQSIKDKLVVHGSELTLFASEAEKVAAPLIEEAWRVATLKERRELTKAGFLRILEKATTQTVTNQRLQQWAMLESKATAMGAASVEFLGGSSDISIQSHSSILYTIPPLFPDFTPRTNLFTNIQAKLQSAGIVVIHGGTGRGKTTLANLTARDTSDSWIWQSFTKKEPSQIVQLLRQLSIEISSQSSQSNVVLDDLNLRPDRLQEYEEMLGVVVYRVLESGAKLLITSQHNPPNNFIRQLGVSSSTVVQVPDFTKSEIEQFAEQLGCPADDAKNCAELVQLHTSGHPRLVHARLAQLREEGWPQPDTIEDFVKPPEEVGEERGAARQLLMALPDDYREFLYRLSLVSTGFRRDYALNIGDIPESVPYAGDIFSQLVGPWIDRFNESYYTISPLLTNAAKEVWPKEKIKQLHAQIANAILQTRNLTQMEAQAVLFHSMVGQNEIGFIAVINSLMTAPEDNWKELSQEFSWLILAKPDIPEKFFPRDALIKHLFRSLQYRIAVEVEPERAPKILEIWDKETTPHEPRQLYLLNRLMLATQALRYYQVLLPAKQMIGYLKEIVDITDNNEAVQEMYHGDLMEQLEEHETDTANYYSFLFSFVVARRPIYAPFLSDLIDALDELPSKTRTLLLADFEDDTIDSRLLIDGVWWSEANRENPNWNRCLQVFDKVIEKAIAWGYPHLAAASAKDKAIIHYECLDNPDAAHRVLQDIVSKVGTIPVIELEQANVYLGQKRYKEALSVYDRILPAWNPSSEKLCIGPPEEYRRAAICAAHLNDWEKATAFFKEGAKRNQRIENTERHIGLYADAGFAQFKAGNMLESIKLLHLALNEFEMLPQDIGNAQNSTLKKRLVERLKWMTAHGREYSSSEIQQLSAGFCSDQEPNEEISSWPDIPMGHAWFHLAQVEYRFGDGATVLDRARQTPDRDTDPKLNFFLCQLEVKHDFRNKNFDNLPKRIHQLVNVYGAIKKHSQTNQGIEAAGINPVLIADPSRVASVESIVIVLVTALLVQLRSNKNVQDMLAVWRANSSELPIKENLTLALDLIESMLSGDLNNALVVIRTKDAKYENRLIAALKIVHNTRTSPDDLFDAHTFITTSLIGNTLEDSVVNDLAELLSAQWLEKIKLSAMLQIPRITVPQIEGACKSSETGKKKIGQILLAVCQATSLRVSSTTLQKFRSWTESIPEQKPEPKTEQNPIAQQIVKVMENPPHLTYEDGEALRQSIEEGKIPVKFDSPFDPDEPDNQ